MQAPDSGAAMVSARAHVTPSYLSDLAVFATVAATLSFKDAGGVLGVSRSTVSKRIAALEQMLGVVLLNRSTRRISLTDAGRRLLSHWQDIEQVVGDAFDSVQGSDLEPSGTLRTSMASSLAAVLMPSLVRNFLSQWPDVQMSVHFGERFVDVVGAGYDVVIRIGEQLTDSVLTAKRLLTSQRVLAASPKYLHTFGEPKNPQELRNHRCLGLGRTTERGMVWRFNEQNRAAELTLIPAFVANNDLALILAACLDVGILYTPRVLIESELQLGRLQVIEMEQHTGPEVGVFAVFPHRQPPAKVRVFVEFVGAELAKQQERDRWRPLAEPAD